MLLGEFLREHAGLSIRQQDLDALDVLTGKSVGYIDFNDAPSQNFEPSGDAFTSPFFYPIGYHNDDEVGLNLLPGHLDWDRLPVAHNDHTEVSDVSPMLADYVRRHLLSLEGDICDEEEDPHEDDSLIEAVATANEAFGEGFYMIGRFGRFSQYAEAYKYDDWFKTSLKHAIPFAREQLKDGHTEMAAKTCNTALKLNHCTVHFFQYGDAKFNKFFEMCRTLYGQHPELFSAEAIRAMHIDRKDKLALAEWVVELYASETQWAAKALLDLCCHNVSYGHPIAHQLIANLYARTPYFRPISNWIRYNYAPCAARGIANPEPWEQLLIPLLEQP